MISTNIHPAHCQVFYSFEGHNKPSFNIAELREEENDADNSYLVCCELKKENEMLFCEQPTSFGDPIRIDSPFS